MIPFVQASALVRTNMPTSLIARYKPVLEEAIAHHEEMVELVEHGNYSIASFVEISLDIIPGISSIQLDNGY